MMRASLLQNILDVVVADDPVTPTKPIIREEIPPTRSIGEWPVDLVCQAVVAAPTIPVMMACQIMKAKRRNREACLLDPRNADRIVEIIMGTNNGN